MKSFFMNNIWRKVTIGFTGLGLALFVLVHMSGNLLLFVGEREYNLYAYGLKNIPGFFLAEIGIMLAFAIHVIWALALVFYNKKAKGGAPEKDSVNSLIHKTLWIQGIIILTFLVLHLITFEYGTYYEVEYDGKKVRNLFLLVTEVFQSPSYVLWYIFSLIILSFHLNHGLQAALRSLGFYHEKYNSKIKIFCLAYTLVVTLGFISQPLYVFLSQGGFLGF